MKILKLIAREIIDSRGIPTVECDLVLEDGSFVSASVPSGLSRSSYEAFELRDGGDRLFGQGVLQAITNIEDIIAPALIGKEPDAVNMDLLLLELDGTEDKRKLGGNAMLAVSIAVLRAQALVNDMEPYELIAHLCDYSSVTLPFPMFNMIQGGIHAPESNVRIQELLVIPVGLQSFRQSMEASLVLFHILRQLAKKKSPFVAIGEEGGIVSFFENDEQALDLLMSAIEKAQKITNAHYLIGLDVAASQFYSAKTGKYNWMGQKLSSDQLIQYYQNLAKNYPLFSIEDGLAEQDYEGWQAMTQALGGSIQIIGDDLFATNPHLIAQGIEGLYATGSIIKPNQIGTVTESLQSIKLCKDNEFTTIVSHRSGETNDSFIVDLVVGTSSNYIKAGGPTRGERVAKYNQLMRIEDELMLSLLES